MSYESDDKMVSHPDHYNSGKYEVIDIIEEFTKDLSGIEAVDTGNAIKYVLRWHKKNGVQDIKKAIWYLTHLAEHLEEKENPSKPHSVIIHKMADGHYAIEDIKDEEKEAIAKDFIEDVSKVEDQLDDGPGLSVNKIISGLRDNGCTVIEAGIDKEESELCAENHINSVGICVPDSEPWGTPGVKRN